MLIIFVSFLELIAPDTLLILLIVLLLFGGEKAA